MPADAGPEAIAEHARQWLANHRQYALPGTPNAARGLEDFLLGTGGGHCEYFATAMAVLLRYSQDGNLKLRAVAEQLIETTQLPDLGGGDDAA